MPYDDVEVEVVDVVVENCSGLKLPSVVKSVVGKGLFRRLPVLTDPPHWWALLNGDYHLDILKLTIDFYVLMPMEAVQLNLHLLHTAVVRNKRQELR